MTPNYGYRGGAQVDVDALEAKAKAATKGTRSVRAGVDGYPQAVFANGVVLIAECFEGPQFPHAEADFIAACDPDTVLELIRLARHRFWLENLVPRAASPSPVEEPPPTSPETTLDVELERLGMTREELRRGFIRKTLSAEAERLWWDVVVDNDIPGMGWTYDEYRQILAAPVEGPPHD